jgi:hypothetical protein
MSIALIFTALVTPYELCFRGKPKIDGFFFCNRLCDIVFVSDIIIQFHVAYYHDTEGVWVMDLKRIKARYLRGSFVLDVISTIPYDILDFINMDSAASNMKVLRILKLLKLTKMVRLAKGMRSLVFLQDMLHLTNRTAAVSGLYVAFLLVTHWIGCIFGLLTGPQFQKVSWATTLGVIPEAMDPDSSVEIIYPYALYFAVNAMVMGETEESKPATKHDRCVCIVCMLVGGLLYAYLISTVTEKLRQKDPASEEYREFCDLVKKYGQDASLPYELRFRLGEYFAASRDVFTAQWYKKVSAHC